MGWLTDTQFLFYGVRNFTRGGYERASKGFESLANADLRGRICAVTGANQGLGLQISKDLAAKGCTLYMLCRNEARGNAAVEQVVQASKNKDVHLRVCDVSSLASIHALVAEFDSKSIRLNLLVNNAGVMMHEQRTSADGYELNFATNTLGTFMLTKQLEAALERAGAGAKVIIVTSGGAYSSRLVVDDVEFKNGKFDGLTQYARDKRRQIALAERFALELGPYGVGVYAMHPGWVDTAGVQTAIPGFHASFEKQLRTPEQGSDTVLWLACTPPEHLTTGALYLDRREQAKHLWLSDTQYSESDVDKLWVRLMSLGGLMNDTAEVSEEATEEVSGGEAPSQPGGGVGQGV